MNNNLTVLNNYTTEIMNSYRFINRVYESGIESKEQFTTFFNLCQNHVNICNARCKALKPIFGFIQINKNKIYKTFKNTCEYTVSAIQDFISTIQAEYDKLDEIEELRETMSVKAQIEYEIATNLKEIEINRQETIRESKKIGFSIPTVKKRKYNKKNKTV